MLFIILINVIAIGFNDRGFHNNNGIIDQNKGSLQNIQGPLKIKQIIS